MTRIFWLVGSAILAVALLAAFRNQASASDAGSCTQIDGFISFCLNVPTTTVRRETTVPLVALPSGRADVLAEVTVPGSDAAALAASVDRSVERVETLFGRTFAARPRVLLFGTSASFAKGAGELFGYSGETAASVAASYGGIFDRPTATIAINWSSAGASRVNAAIEHELTHQMIREMSGGREIPMWFDEGLATLVQGELEPVPTPLLSFRDLDSLSGFHRTYASVGNVAYEFSAAAVRAIEARAGWAGMLMVLRAVGDGAAFDDAYQQVAGEGVASLEARVRVPGIEVSPLDRGGNVTWTLATAAANSEVHVRIAGGRSYEVTFTITTDALGMYRGTFGSTASPGMYTITAGPAVATFSTVR